MAAVSLSIFAEGMWAVVMTLQVIALDNDPTSLSLVATCLAAGLVGFVLVGGLAADRLSQRGIIIVVEAVNTAVVSVVAVLGLVGALRIWHMAVAAAALGIAAAFFFPAYSAILPRILPAEQLLAANGVEGVVRPVFQRAVGPAIAGLVVGATFPSVGAVVVAALFAVGLLLLVATRPSTKAAVPQATSAAAVAAGSARRLRRSCWAHRGCCGHCCSRACSCWWYSARSRCCCPSSCSERFTHGAQTYGFILAFFGMGSALGALAVSSRRLPRRYLTVMMAMWSVGSIPLAVVGVTSSFPVMAAATFVSASPTVRAWSSGARCCSAGCRRRCWAGCRAWTSSCRWRSCRCRSRSSGPLSKVVSMETIFLAAGVAPVLLAAVAMWAARMRRDELAHPLR